MPSDVTTTTTPGLSRNPVSAIGAALTTVGAVAFLTFVALDLFGFIDTPYAGLLGYILIPAIFVVGLLLIPMGMWRESRRRSGGHGPWQWPNVNLNSARSRNVISLVVLLTIVNLAIVGVASVGVVHYTESNQFCGQVCHTPMTPEFTAHKTSAHSKVECVSCHVGPGPKGLISAKMNGTRQLYLVMTGQFSRPIPEPVGRIPEAAGTCAQCHTPGRPSRDITRVLTSYGDDEHSTENVTTLTMLMSANHWHARAGVAIDYASDNGRQNISYVTATDEQGHTTEYFADNVKARPAGTLHRMDCIDCHNRPAHTFSATAERAVDAVMAAGGVNRSIPFVHREMVTALKASYQTEAAGVTGIEQQMTKAFQAAGPTLAPDVQHAITAAQQIYQQNVFPTMKVTWGTYITNLGHIDAPGCFRCHDGSHTTRAGVPIRQDCELCHKVR